MSDAPIDEQNYIYGMNVVEIGDIRVARGLTRRPASSCRHRKMVYDEKERRVWCKDCEQEIEGFDAFVSICQVWHSAYQSLERRKREITEAETFTLRSRAAKVLDQVWRSHTMAPLCPHCHDAILPEDVANGVAQASRELYKRRRKKEIKP